jgi:N-acetylneuraminic acid mutarotase
MSLLPDGRVLIWEDDNPNGQGRGTNAYTFAYVWDIAANSFTSADNTTADVFCSGHAFLLNGQLLVAGGHNGSANNGLRTGYLFDSSSNTWTVSSSLMTNGRWYPTVTSLANGEMLVVSGDMTSAQGVNPIPEVWQTNNGGGWRELGSASMSLPLYPWMHLAPNGQVFNAGPNANTRYLDTSGTGAWSAVANHITGGRDYGSSVMYDEGKVIVIGGGNPVKTAEIIDLNGSTPSWQRVGSMAYARRQMNATLLPDGKVLVTGGSSSTGFNDATLAVLPAEMWDPATKSFSTMASMQVPRMYHSTTVLLPDGRVLSAGGGRPAATGTTDQPNAEIYSPPYLFQADGSPAVRPVITSVSATNVTYGQQFSVATPDAATITDVTWIRLSSTTHSFNQNQRINQLGFTTTGSGLTAAVPSSAALCPPGHYMLFILRGGVPSIGKIMQIQ